MQLLSQAYITIQQRLFPALTEEIGDLSEKQQELVRAFELMAPLMTQVLGSSDYAGIGCPMKSRHNIFRAFIAKSIMCFHTTGMLIEQLRGNTTLRYLCGWDGRNEVPSEATFSRAFAEFTASNAVARLQSLLVKDSHQEKIVGHCSKDSTAVHAREHHCRTHKKPLVEKKKRGRRPKGAPPPEPVDPRRIELQGARSLQVNICDLPKGCDWGSKKNSQGKCEQWKGYKLHADYSDAGVPLSLILTSASVHDSQVAIPLMQMTCENVKIAFYDLMDAAYDAKEIRDFSMAIGHVPLIDPNPRSGPLIPLAPAQAARYTIRTTSERGFSELKDNYGLENIRVKGHWKVFCHVMFSVLALTCKTLFNMIC